MGNQASVMQSTKLIRPLSACAKKIMELGLNPETSFAEFQQFICCDPMLMGSIFKVANCPTLAIERKQEFQEVSSIEGVLSVIGERALVGIALGICALQIFEKDTTDEQKLLWQHSLQTAIAAKTLCQYSTKPIDPDTAFTAGILHNIGKLVISEHLKNIKTQAMRKLQLGDIPDFLAVEKAVAGTDHTEVGGVMSIYWNLPSSIAEAMLYHHFPSASSEEHRHLVYLIHLSDFVAMMKGVGQTMDSLQYQLHKDYKQYIRVSIKQFEKIFFTVGEEFEKISSILFPKKEE